MVHYFRHILFLLIFSAYPWFAFARPLLHHEFRIVLEPGQGRLRIEDTVSLPDSLLQLAACWKLHSGLKPRVTQPLLKLRQTGESNGAVTEYCLELPAGQDRFTVTYAGPVRYPKLPMENRTAGPPISTQGVYLDGNSHWYPRFGDDEQLSFQLTAHLPPQWQAVTQGVRRRREEHPDYAVETWEETHPQEAIDLVAAPFHEYRGDQKPAQAWVFLRHPDPDLAQRYLQATSRYLKLYSRLLGPYPYGKFALVENNWESGYGMPSFTLLGARVIRLPFILYTSYPHEILHNWWGNGVYVDYRSGNWSEGLTAYLADYWLRERQGKGAGYRRDALQRYSNYVDEGKDFPLTAFRTRHNEATQSVGYDKGLLFFHMLRRQLGDKTFLAGLQRFYREHLFQKAGFKDLQTAFETVSGLSLDAEFHQWLTRTGAPALSLSEVKTQPLDGQFRISAVLQQTQSGPPYQLSIPLALQLEGRSEAWQTSVGMSAKHLALHLTVPSRPWRLAVDPQFDLMRRLDPAEMPPSVGQVLGAKRMLIILPGAAPDKYKTVYQVIAEVWATERGAEIHWDKDLKTLPENRNIWLFGWENRFLNQLSKGLNEQPVTLTNPGVTLLERFFPRQRFGAVLVTRHPANRKQALAWLAWNHPLGLAAMARKLKHYGKYSYLVFTDDKAANVLKGQWPVTDSPLNRGVAQWDGAKPLPWSAQLTPRPALHDW